MAELGSQATSLYRMEYREDTVVPFARLGRQLIAYGDARRLLRQLATSARPQAIVGVWVPSVAPRNSRADPDAHASGLYSCHLRVL